MSSNLMQLLCKLTITLTILTHSIYSFQFSPLYINSVSTKIINQEADYQFQYDRAIDAGGVLTPYQSTPLTSSQSVSVTFPEQYSNLAFQNIVCKASINSGAYSTYPCSAIENLRQVVITGIFSDGQIVSLVHVIIEKILNPIPAGVTGKFKGTIGSDFSEQSFGDVVALQPGQFQSCSITFDPSNVNTISDMVLLLDPQNQIPIEGSIQIEFSANQWTNQIQSSSLLPIKDSMACKSYSSNIQSSIACSGNFLFLRITASNIFFSPTSTSFQFGVQNFISPPTIQPSDTVAVTSYVDGKKIDQCTASISGLTPKSITTLSVTDINGDSLMVNQVYTLQFTFLLSGLISGGDYFTIQFPPGTQYTFISSTVTGSPSLVRNSAKYDSTTRTATLYMSDPSKTYSAGSKVSINLGNYKAPASIYPTEDITLTIFRNGKSTQSGTTNIIALKSSLTASVSIANKTVNSNTQYTFMITITDDLSSTGKVRIKFPSQIKILNSNTNCATVTGSSMKTSPICIIDQTVNTITLTDLSSGSNIPAQTMIIAIQEIQNPSSTAPTSEFSISTFYSSSDLTLTSDGIASGFTPLKAQIFQAQIQISPSQQIVNESPVTYTFSLTIQHPLVVGSYFYIYIPKEVEIDEASVFGHCQINTNGLSYRVTACEGSVIDADYSVIKFTNPFLQRIQKNTKIIARVKTVFKNPPSTAPTPTFRFSTYYSNDYIVAETDDDNSPVQMKTAASFQNIQISRISNKNLEPTIYEFTMEQQSRLDGNSRLLISFPSQVKPSSSSLCTMIEPIASALTCTLDSISNRIDINLPSGQIAGLAKIKISISQIKNPPSFKPIADIFKFQSKTALSIGDYYYSYSTHLPSYLVNKIPIEFQSLNYHYIPLQLGQPAELNIKFKSLDSSIITLGQIRITIANDLIINNLQCKNLININGETCTISSPNTISIKGTYNQVNIMEITVTGFTIPNQLPSTSSYSSVVSFDSEGFKIDQSVSDINFALACQLPCKKCNPSKLNECLSCYDNTIITEKIYYDSTLKLCFKDCPSGKYQTQASPYICDSCFSQCQTCQGSATFCTSCKQSTLLKYLSKISSTQQECVQVCPDTFYPDASITPITCTKCVAPCQKCLDELTCESCLGGTYLFNQKCESDCPDSYYVENSVDNTCDPCDSSCVTCESLITACTSCPDTKLLYLNKCLDNCPDNLVPQKNTCGGCDQTCLTCIQNPFKCTSCQPSSSLPYYYAQENSCLGDCPQLYYNNVNKCTLCSSLTNRHCSRCSSETVCLVCDGNYILYQDSCVLSLPDGYINISNIAVPCQGDCSTCQINPTNCTSCKNNYLLDNQCLTSCPPKYTQINNVCEACQSPCKTCQSEITACLSCLTDLNPQVYLAGTQCKQTCPDFTYPSESTNQCKACVSPCQKCRSQTYCLTCVSSYYLNNKVCVSSCPKGYVGIQSQRLCKICLGNCATCQQNQNKCTTCRQNTYLLDGACVTDCGLGYYRSELEQSCKNCPQNCPSCLNTATCLSCQTGKLYNGDCIEQCPSKFYNDNQRCLPCPKNCSACVSSNTCTACTGQSMLFQNKCINTCPKTHSVVIDKICSKCSKNLCHECTNGDYCTQCISGNSLLLGECYEQCPVRYKSNGTHCQDTNQAILTSDSSFPLPFTIATAIVLIACLMSKLQFNHTFMPGAVYSFLGILQWGALVYFSLLYFTQMLETTPLPFYLGVGALGYLYLLNFLSTIIQNFIFCKDKHYNGWNKGPNFVCSIITNITATIISHKFRNILFSKLFTFSVFTAQLEDISKFKAINVFSFLSLLHSGASIAAAGFSLVALEQNTQIFYQALDVIIVTGLNIPLAFFNIMKTKTFFYERTTEGFDLKKKNQLEGFNIEDKLEPAGIDQEEQIGFQTNFRYQIGSSQQLKFVSRGNWAQHSENQWQSSGDSKADLMEKKWQEVSIQAVEMLNEDEDKYRAMEKFQKEEESKKNEEQQIQESPTVKEQIISNDKIQRENSQKKHHDSNIDNIKAGPKQEKTSQDKNRKKQVTNFRYKPNRQLKPKKNSAKVPFSWVSYSQKMKQQGYFDKEQSNNQAKLTPKKQLNDEFMEIQQQIPETKQIIFQDAHDDLLQIPQKPLEEENQAHQFYGNDINQSEEKSEREGKQEIIENIETQRISEYNRELQGRIISKQQSIEAIKNKLKSKQKLIEEKKANLRRKSVTKKDEEKVGKLYHKNDSQINNISEHIEQKDSSVDENPINTYDQDIHEEIFQDDQPSKFVYEEENNQINEELRQQDESLPLPVFSQPKIDHSKEKVIKVNPKEYTEYFDDNDLENSISSAKERQLQEINKHPLNAYDHRHSNTIEVGSLRKQSNTIQMEKDEVQIKKYNNRYENLMIPQENDRQQTEFSYQKQFGRVMAPTTGSHRKLKSNLTSSIKKQTESGYHHMETQSYGIPTIRDYTLKEEQPQPDNNLNQYYMNYFMDRPQTGVKSRNNNRSRDKSKQKNLSRQKSIANMKSTENIYMQKLTK